MNIEDIRNADLQLLSVEQADFTLILLNMFYHAWTLVIKAPSNLTMCEAHLEQNSSQKQTDGS